MESDSLSKCTERVKNCFHLAPCHSFPLYFYCSHSLGRLLFVWQRFLLQFLFCSLQTYLSKHEDFCPLYFKPSTFAPPPVLNFLCVEHLMLIVYQWKVSVVAFRHFHIVLRKTSFFFKPAALISHASSLFAFMLGLTLLLSNTGFAFPPPPHPPSPQLLFVSCFGSCAGCADLRISASACACLRGRPSPVTPPDLQPHGRQTVLSARARARSTTC